MKLAQKGDSDAYRKLLAELSTMLEKYALRAVKRSSSRGDTTFAKDIVQEVLLAIHAKRHTYEPSQRFLPWVFGIARHKLVDWQRKHFFEFKSFDFEFDLSEFPADEVPSDPQMLQSLLGQLSSNQRTVLELTKIQGLSIEEAAKKTGLSEANVKVLAHRGILTLRKIVEAQHD